MQFSNIQYPPNYTPVPGDMFLTHSPSFFGKIIRFGESLRRPSRSSFFNHAGIIVSANGDTIEAWGRGVVRKNLTVHKTVWIIPHNSDHPTDIVKFAMSTEKDPYGWLDIVSISVRLLTGLSLSFHGTRSLICSQLAAKAWEHGGWICPELDTAAVMPADLAYWLLPKSTIRLAPVLFDPKPVNLRQKKQRSES
jgi:hypothetical protein